MAQRNKSSEYWAKRFELLEESQHEIGVQCFADIEGQYRLAQKEIEKEIAKWYTRFAENNSITMQQARKLLTDKQLEEFKWDVNEYIRYGEENAISGTWAKQLENASARYHISRLEALKIHTQHHLEVLFGNQLDYIDAAMRDAYVHSYNHTAYEIQKGIGVGWDFSKLDESKISKVINKPWAVDGKNFSERIWGNGQRLVKQLHSELTRNIVLGKDPQKSILAIAKKMETSKAAAGKLIMTESAFFSTAGQKDCFTELDVEEFEVIETLDSHTCSQCGDMDGKHFPMTEWIVGVTVPPFHPWCRGTTAPYFEDDFGVIGERAARDADGKTYYVPADMTYEQWEKKYLKDAITEKDRHLFEKYKATLGDNAPNSIDNLMQIRYNNQEWKQFTEYVRAIQSGELTPLASFELYKNINKQMDDKLVGAITSTGVKITGKSYHSIARVIGSVEQRRNGVAIDDVLDALISEDSEIFPIRTTNKGRSQKFRKGSVEVSINLDTGNIIQVNPVHKRKKVKS